MTWTDVLDWVAVGVSAGSWGWMTGKTVSNTRRAKRLRAMTVSVNAAPLTEEPVVYERMRGCVVGFRSWSFGATIDSSPSVMLVGHHGQVWPEREPMVAKCATGGNASRFCHREGINRMNAQVVFTCTYNVLGDGLQVTAESCGRKLEKQISIEAAMQMGLSWERTFALLKAEMTHELLKEVERGLPGNARRCPGLLCTCGIYAYSSWEHMQLMNGFNPREVAGAVAGWGKVVLCEHGWRAEKVRIVALAMPRKPPKALRKIAEAYGVPLVAPKHLEMVAKEHGEVVY